MAKSNKYADAAFEVLSEMGGGPVRSKELVEAVQEKGDLPDTKYFYHYVLKACKEDERFDTSERGRIGLALQDMVGGIVGTASPLPGETEETSETSEVGACSLPAPERITRFGAEF